MSSSNLLKLDYLKMKLPKLDNILVFKDEKDMKLLERACILNENIDSQIYSSFNYNIYYKTAIKLYDEFHADPNTIIATLIYNYVRKFRLPDYVVVNLFNEDILNKVKLLNTFNEDLLSCSYDNEVSFIKSINKDVKVTIIKLIERLCTFETMNEEMMKQSYNFVAQTLDFYVPVAKLLGIYKIKNELEDACFKYDESYDEAMSIKENISKEYFGIVEQITNAFSTFKLDMKKHIILKLNERSIYDIYLKAEEIARKVKELNNDSAIKLFGFCSIKCLVNTKQECYNALYLIHHFMHQIGSFNDFLTNVQGNEYRSIHTNVFINSCLVDFRIHTKEMDKVNLLGVAANWRKNSNLQHKLASRYQFYSDLELLISSIEDEDLVRSFKRNVIDEQLFNIESISKKREKVLDLYRKDKK